MRPRIRVWGKFADKNYGAARDDLYLDRAVVMDENDEVSGVLFAVEDAAGHPFREPCYSESDCLDVELRVVEDTGELYLYDPGWGGWVAYLNDVPAWVAELSAEAEDGSGQKIYKQSRVASPRRRPDCGDYLEMNEDRYVCMFLGELLPADAPETSQELRAALPKLVQDKENYSLVFAEEFNGNQNAADSEECQDGFLTLSVDLWSFKGDPCQYEAPCENVEDGHYRISRTSVCGAGLNTFGKTAFKYGYLELKYTVNLPPNVSYKNYAIYGGGTMETRYMFDRYGLNFTSKEKSLKYAEIELDFVEYVPPYRKDIWHQYFNWFTNVKNAESLPLRSNKQVYYCRSNLPTYSIGGTHPSCEDGIDGKVTVTKGVEWTPRGFQTHVKVDGWHSDFTLYPHAKTEIQESPGARLSNGVVTGFDGVRTVTGEGRDRFFELFRPGDESSRLEKVSVSHMPADVRIRAWGFSTPSSDDPVANMHLDYIRIFQPADRYAAMEPVYQ